MRATSAVLLLAALAAVSPAASEPNFNVTSLLGCPRVAAPAAAGNPHEPAIAALRERLARDPGDAESRVWLGRRLAYLGRYQEAIETFSEGVRRFPDDARFLRHRGHRYLSIRQIDKALADFEAAALLVAGKPDLVENDGLPNLFNQPTSTLKDNIWYHLGLAHYLRGDFVRAGEAFESCRALAANPDMVVASTYWRYLSLRRQDRDAEASALLAGKALQTPLIENTDYQHLLDLFRGDRDLASFGAQDGASVGSATQGYGLAVYLEITGKLEEARAAYTRVIGGSAWPAFGHLAAEAELARQGIEVPCE